MSGRKATSPLGRKLKAGRTDVDCADVRSAIYAMCHERATKNRPYCRRLSELGTAAATKLPPMTLFGLSPYELGAVKARARYAGRGAEAWASFAAPHGKGRQGHVTLK